MSPLGCLLTEQSFILLRYPYFRSISPKGKKILLFNPIALEREEEDDGKVKEPERPPKIRRTTRPNGKVVYEF